MGGRLLDFEENDILNRGREEERENGIKAIVDLCKSLGGSSLDAVEKIVANMSISQAEANSLVSKYW